LSIFRKYVTKVSLKSDKNKGYLTRRPTHIYDNISLNSYNQEIFRQKFPTKSKHAFYIP